VDPNIINNQLKSIPQLDIAHRIAGEFSQARVYLVGGVVRDVVAGKQVRDSKDIDMVVSGVPQETLQTFLESIGRVSLVGNVFGVLKFRPPNTKEEIDIALPRTEVKRGERGGYRDVHVDVDHLLPIEKDLERRDFTINAMAIDLSAGVLIDPFGGREDMYQRVIRAVGDPQMRFAEDRTRILRAIRFAACFGYTIEKRTWDALLFMPIVNESKQFIPSKEMIAREWVRATQCNPAQALTLLANSNILAQIYDTITPIIFDADRIKQAIEQLATIPDPNEKDANLIMALFFSRLHSAKITTTIASELRLSTTNIVRADTVIALHTFLEQFQSASAMPDIIELDRLFFGNNSIGYLLRDMLHLDARMRNDMKMQEKNAELEHLLDTIKNLPRDKNGNLKLVLSAKEVMEEFNVAPGNTLGDIMNDLKRAQLDGKITTKDQAHELVRQRLVDNS
jgi:tRNA nucleotidyltransferase/poly(A) polymerase